MAKRIYINNEVSVTDVRTVSELAEWLQLPERGVALAVNNKVVSRADWAETPLSDDDRVTVIKAAFGG